MSMSAQQQSQEIKLSLKWVELIPRPTMEEVDHITQSIRKNGLQTPVTVDQDHVLLDGYTRQKICKRLNIPIKFIVKHFKDDNARTDFVLISNVERRHLKAFDRVRLFRQIYEDLRKDAKKKQINNLRGLTGLKPSRAELNKNRSIYKFAKKIGISEGTATRAMVVLDEGSKKEIGMVTKGVISITSMYHTIAKRKRRMDERLMPCTIIIKNKYTEKTKTIEKRLTRDLYDNLIQHIERL